MQHRNSFNYAALAEQVNSFNLGSVELLKKAQGLLFYGGASQTDAQSGAIALVYSLTAKLARLQALNDTMLVISAIAILTIIPTLLLKEKKRLDDEMGPIASIDL
jgi:hypothetical protein